MIHNVFNKDLLTKCKESQFKSQHMKPTLLLNIVNKEKKYKVEEIRNYRKQVSKSGTTNTSSFVNFSFNS